MTYQTTNKNICILIENCEDPYIATTQHASFIKKYASSLVDQATYENSNCHDYL